MPWWSGMKKAFGLFVRQTKSLNKEKITFVGQDHIGNKYFEAYRPNHSRPVQRYFERTSGVKNFDDVVDAANVPPPWDTWLRFRRKDPPSEAELKESDDYFQYQQALAAKKREAMVEKSAGQPEKKIPEGSYEKK